MTKIYWFAAGLFMCTLTFQSLSQEQIIPVSRFALNVSYNRFWKNDSTEYLEIATAVYPRFISFKKDSANYLGRINISIVIREKLKDTVIYARWYGVPVTFRDSTEFRNAKSIINKMVYVLNRGNYSIAVHGYDGFDKKRCDSSITDVTIDRKPPRTIISDLELCSNITESADTNDIFYKNSYRAIPNPGLLFGSTTFPVVFTYMELYNLKKDFLYQEITQIVNPKGEIIKEKKRMRKSSSSDIVDVATMNVTSITSGKYKVAFILSDTVGNEIARSERAAYIFNPQIKPSAESLISAKSAEFSGMNDDELIQEFRETKYIASVEDIKIFDKLSTGDARRQFLAKFWSNIENSSYGQEGLTRAMYLKRVGDANQRYNLFNKEGWRTDRGRVYILYGNPDEIERHPSSGDSKPYEIWNYYHLENGVQFIFIDRTGFNNYMLMHSTKRGEIQDENWQQYLQ